MTAELVALFAAAFLAATLLPGASEAALAASIKLGSAPVWLAISVATFGNTLGSLMNWVMGYFFAQRLRGHRLFPIKPDQFARYEAIYQRWGVWSLLLSWAPVIGDPITAIAGVMRTPLRIFIPVVAAAKLARFLAVAWTVGLF